MNKSRHTIDHIKTVDPPLLKLLRQLIGRVKNKTNWVGMIPQRPKEHVSITYQVHILDLGQLQLPRQIRQGVTRAGPPIKNADPLAGAANRFGSDHREKISFYDRRVQLFFRRAFVFVSAVSLTQTRSDALRQ